MMVSRRSKVFSLSLAQGVVMASTLILSIVFTRVLTKEDYATYLQTFLAYDFLKPVLTLGLPVALFNLLPGEKRGKKVVVEVMILLFFTGLIYSVFMIVGGTELLAKRFSNPHLKETLPWMIFFPLYTFPVLCMSAVLIVNNRVDVNSKYNILTGVGLTAFVIIAALIGNDYSYPLFAKILFPLAIFPMAIVLCFKYTNGQFEMPEWKNLMKILKFSVPIGLATTLATIALQLSNIIVSSFCPPSDFAIYSTGARELPFISIITGSIAVVLMADMSSQIKEGNVGASLALFQRATAASSMFLIPVMVFLMLHGESFIRLLYTDAYTESTIPFRIFLFYLPIRIAQYNSVYIAFGQSKAVLVRSAVHLLITLFCCLIFVRVFGFWGAALGAIVASYIWEMPYNIYKLSSCFKCGMTDVLPFRRIGQVLLISMICGLMSLPLCFIINEPLAVLPVSGIIFLLLYYYLMSRYCKDFKMITSAVVNRYLYRD